MAIHETKANVKARIWQSIAQSDVSLTAIPQSELETLVDAIADGVLVAVDEALADAGMAARQTAYDAAGITSADEEEILWEGRPFLSLITHFQITNQRVRIIRGILGKDRDDIELIRIQDLDLEQGMTERMLNLGDIVIHSSDPSTPRAELYNLTNPQDVHEVLRRAMLDARRRYRYSVQEEM